ncbi:MAG: O-antigen ligase family protein [Persicimonas sp.]
MSETSGEVATDESPRGPSLSVPSWIVLALVGLAPTIFATGFSNYEAVKEIALVGGLGAALAWWGVLVWRERSVAVAAGRAATLAILFGVYVLAASAWAPNALSGLWEAAQLAALAVVVLLVLAPVGRALRLFDFATAVAVGAGVAGVTGILDLVGVGVFTVIWDPPGPTGAFDAMEFATAYYAVALPVLMASIFRYAGRWRVLFAVAFALAGFHFGLMAGWEMAAIFAGVCAAAALILFAFERLRATIALTPALILLGALAVFVAVGQWGFEPPEPTSEATSLPHLSKPDFDERDYKASGRVRNIVFSPDRMESITSWESRDYLLGVSTEMFAEQPIVGHGAGAWWALQTKHIDMDHPYVSGWFDWYPAFRSPHNGAAKLMVEYGLTGLILFALFVVAALGVVVASVGAGGDPTEWMLDHWALLASGLAGLVFLFLTPLLELAPAALTWAVALAIGLRLSAERLGFRGWTQRWSLGADEEGGALAPVMGVTVIAVVLGVAMVALSVLNLGAGVHRGHADHLMLRTAYEDAIEAYEASERWLPTQGDVPLNIAIAAARTGEHDRLAEAAERAVEMRPHDVRALERRGRVELGGNKGEVLHYARRAVEAFPNSFAARKLLIAAHDVRGEHEKSIEAALEMLDKDPPRSYRAQLHLTVGDVYSEIMEDTDNAKKHYERALDLVDAPQRQIKLKDKIEKLDESGEGGPPMMAPPGDDGHGH